MKFLLDRRSNIVLRIEGEFEECKRANQIREPTEVEEQKEAIRRQQRIESKNFSVRSRFERSSRIQNERNENHRREEENRARYLREREITEIRRRPTEYELHNEEKFIDGRMRANRYQHYTQNISEGFFQRPTLNEYGTAGRCCMMQEESKDSHPKFHSKVFIADNIFE